MSRRLQLDAKAAHWRPAQPQAQAARSLPADTAGRLRRNAAIERDLPPVDPGGGQSQRLAACENRFDYRHTPPVDLGGMLNPGSKIVR